MEQSQFERKLQRFGPEDWEEFGAALKLENAKLLELPTARDEEGSSGSISPLELDIIGNAVITHLEDYKNALYGTQVGLSCVHVSYVLQSASRQYQNAVN